MEAGRLRRWLSEVLETESSCHPFSKLGVLVGQIRRILSVSAVRAQAECLLSRLRNVGGGAGAAYRRRQGVDREEVSWARERQAQAVGRRQGRKVVRHGMFLLN